MEIPWEDPKCLESICLGIFLSDCFASLTEDTYSWKVLPQIFLTNPCIFLKLGFVMDENVFAWWGGIGS